ncbi:MAG TPA: CBS domain-containing protein [Steroidobacteraceae bacterium]|nr:CBS domain-containing protein [Steroidobacteraceae bacterium]
MLVDAFCMMDVACCSPRATVLEAAHLMRRRHTGDLVVVDDDEARPAPIGVLTDRDIVVEVLAKGLDPAVTTVGSVIRTPVVVAQGTEDSSVVLERMRAHGVRRIPVIGTGGKLVGIVTVDDLLKRLAAEANLLTEIVSQEQNHEARTRR